MEVMTTGDRRRAHERLELLDDRHVLHPMTAHQSAPAPIFSRGSGSWLYDTLDNPYLDAFSGLMNVNLGYGRADLAAIAAEQMRRLAYSPLFFGYRHGPSIELAARLAELTPAPISHFHFTNSGSEAIESAVKLARRHFAARGQPEKTTVITRRGGYHGATYGALTWTGNPLYHQDVGPLLPGAEQIGPLSVEDLEATIARVGAGSIAAMIAEPVAMSAGLRIPSQRYWDDVQALLAEHDIRLILDEVVTGLGRTGRWFGADHWGIEPDFQVIAKGLTSGYATLAAVGVSAAIAEELRSSTPLFNSGFTMGGNQVACAVALESIAILERERLPENATAVGLTLRDRIAAELADAVQDVRAIGLLVGFELRGDGTAEPAGAAVIAGLLAQGVLARAYGDTVVVGPPLVAAAPEVDALLDGLATVLRRDRGSR